MEAGEGAGDRGASAPPMNAEPRITFVRHGQSTANAGGLTMAHAAIPLSEQRRLALGRVGTDHLVVVYTPARADEATDQRMEGWTR